MNINYRYLFEKLKFGYFITDLTGKIEEINSIALEIFNISEKTALNKFCYEIVKQFNRNKFIKTSWQIMKSMNPWIDFNYDISTKNKEIFVDISIMFIQDSEYKSAGFIFLFKDTTNIKNIEDRITLELKEKTTELENTKNYISRIIESLVDSLIVVDVNGKIKTVNNALLNLLGYKKTEIIDKSIIVIADIDMKNDSFLTKLKNSKNKDSINDYFMNLITKAGKLIPVNCACSVIRNNKNKIESIVTIAHDIREKLKAEHALQEAYDQMELKVKERTKELAKKNEDLDRFNTIISHDLRTPLMNIYGFGKLLGGSITDIYNVIKDVKLSSKSKNIINPIFKTDIPESLEIIISSVSKMDSLIIGLRRLSEIGRTALNIKKININKLIQLVLIDCKYYFNEANVSVNVEKLPSCVGDEGQIFQIFSNLVGNAFKYRHPKRKCIIKISGYKEKDRVVYCVADNGIGIEKEYQDRIFEVFHRLNPDKTQGDGLGLNIIKEILSRLKGDIWIESEFGKGSKFFFSLPLISYTKKVRNNVI